jgi:hypothetical protein
MVEEDDGKMELICSFCGDDLRDEQVPGIYNNNTSAVICADCIGQFFMHLFDDPSSDSEGEYLH